MEKDKIKLCPFKKMQINCGPNGKAIELTHEGIQASADDLACAQGAKVTREEFEQCVYERCMAFDEVNNRCNLIPKSEVHTKSFLKEEENDSEKVKTLKDVRKLIYDNYCIHKEMLNILLKFSEFETAKRLADQLDTEYPQRLLDSDSDIKIVCNVYKNKIDADKYFVRIEVFRYMKSKIADETLLCVMSNDFKSIVILDVEPILDEWEIMEN